MRNFWILIFAGLLSTSCVTVRFTEPQPAGVQAMDEFPPSFCGTYLLSEYGYADHSDLDTLVIFPKGFLAISMETEEYSTEDIQNNPNILIRDSLIFRMDRDPEKGYVFTRTDSTIQFSYWEREESYLSDSLILKNYAGEYYLSVRDDEGGYNVLLLKTERNGDLIAWMVDPENEIETFRTIRPGFRKKKTAREKPKHTLSVPNRRNWPAL
ncbi:MAG: hypothetical protein R3C61_05320 [Bacteroidia bacterium]